MPQMKRITLPTVAVSVLLLILGTSGAWYVLRLQRTHSHVLDANVSSIRAAEEMEIAVRELRYELGRYRVMPDRQQLAQALEHQEVAERWWQVAAHLPSSAEENDQLQKIDQGLDVLSQSIESWIEGGGELPSPDAVDHVVESVLNNDVLEHLHQYLDLNEVQLQQSSEQNKRMAERLALALLLLGTCGAVAGLVAGYGMARLVSRSIFQLSVRIRDVAGKLNEIVCPVEVSADPSVADLEVILKTVADRVETVVEQLQARHREVIRADQLAAVGQLAAGMAHELRNPLMCIKTLIQAAQRKGMTASLDERDLQVLDEEISRLENLLQAFMDFARPANLERQNVDVSHVVRQTVSLLSSKAAVRDVSIECQLADEPLVVSADSNQLRQVLLNLLLNALEAVQNGGRIWVEADRGEPVNGHHDHDGPSPHIRLSVADNGKGLPVDDPQRVFEPFFSTKETGLGLGLAVTQRIIDAHGGEITAYTRDAGGTTFQVRLPAESHA